MFAHNTSLMIYTVSIFSLIISQVITKWRFINLDPGEDGAADKLKYIISALSDGWLWLAGIMVIISAVCWYVALSRLPLSFMLPIAGIIAPTSAIIAYFVLKEPISSGQLGAIALIFAGVVWLGYQQ